MNNIFEKIIAVGAVVYAIYKYGEYKYEEGWRIGSDITFKAAMDVYENNNNK